MRYTKETAEMLRKYGHLTVKEFVQKVLGRHISPFANLTDEEIDEVLRRLGGPKC